MKNKYLRLFVAQTQLMTAEKMKLDRFCQHDEYLAYRISLPRNNDDTPEDDINFVFDVELENKKYSFTTATITDASFSIFERHMSKYLNVLFQRKVDFEKRNAMFKDIMQKLVTELTEEEQQCLATNIDANTTNVLLALGVKKPI
jgi:hypothetical protein